jgi:hypothetical protein
MFLAVDLAGLGAFITAVIGGIVLLVQNWRGHRQIDEVKKQVTPSNGGESLARMVEELLAASVHRLDLHDKDLAKLWDHVNKIEGTE